MARKLRNSGFSLMEVLLSVGTLAIGMSFIAGVFPVAIYLATISTERTTAAIVADEAFAKIRLYAPNLPEGELVPIQTLCSISQDEFFYPSTEMSSARKQYSWSALCRKVGLRVRDRDVQVTVFVCRRIGGGIVPIEPVEVGISQVPGRDNELKITGDKRLINDGYTIVDDQAGNIYRVLERYAPPDDDTVVLLDRDWEGGASGFVWVVPAPQFGGRYPCVAIYQKVMRF